MFSALKILAGVALYRLRKREMANLFAALTIMAALRLPWDDILVRTGFGALLNLLAYLTNDYCDVDIDLASPGKDREKALFLKAHMRTALVTQIVLALLLGGVAFLWDPGLLLALGAGAGICWVYSAWLKKIPVVDVVAMLAWGVAMPLVGLPLDRALGWWLVGQLGLFSACFQVVQLVRDNDEDARAGNRTTSVLLGIGRAIVLERFLMVASALYAILVLNKWVGLALLAAPFLPFDRSRTETYWNQLRLVQGLAWLGMVAWIAWHGLPVGILVLPGLD